MMSSYELHGCAGGAPWVPTMGTKARRTRVRAYVSHMTLMTPLHTQRTGLPLLPETRLNHPPATVELQPGGVHFVTILGLHVVLKAKDVYQYSVHPMVLSTTLLCKV